MPPQHITDKTFLIQHRTTFLCCDDVFARSSSQVWEEANTETG